jgi:hypothetical protein
VTTSRDGHGCEVRDVSAEALCAYFHKPPEAENRRIPTHGYAHAGGSSRHHGVPQGTKDFRRIQRLPRSHAAIIAPFALLALPGDQTYPQKMAVGSRSSSRSRSSIRGGGVIRS